MIISHQHQFIYYAPMKTATSTITDVLTDHFGAELMGGRHDCFLPIEYESYFAFASVRNPYERARSGWTYFETQKNPNPTKTLEQWIAMPWFGTMFDCLFSRQKEGCLPVRLDAIIHVETLDRDFNNLPFVKTPFCLPHKNRSKTIVEVSDEARGIIREKYKLDFLTFGYNP